MRHIYKISGLVVGLAMMMLTSCGTTKRVTATTPVGQTVNKPQRPKVDHIDIAPTLPHPTQKLLSEASSWLGTRYQYGGSERDGVDCSGLVVNVFDNALNIKLPRTSATQQEYCTPIDVENLREGDLVFFTTSDRSRVGHVGIYIGDGNMIHSSSSRGVIVSSLSQKYYVDNLYGYGRVDKFFSMIEDRDKIETTAPVLAKTEVEKSTERTITAKEFAQNGFPVKKDVKPVRVAKLQIQDESNAPKSTSVSQSVTTAATEQDEEFLSDFFD